MNITDKLRPAKVNRICLPGHCNGPACSQLASRPTRHRCKTVGLHASSFRKMSFLVMTTPLDIKPTRCFCIWSVRVCVQNFAIVGHDVSEEIGPDKTNKLLDI